MLPVLRPVSATPVTPASPSPRLLDPDLLPMLSVAPGEAVALDGGDVVSADSVLGDDVGSASSALGDDVASETLGVSVLVELENAVSDPLERVESVVGVAVVAAGAEVVEDGAEVVATGAEVVAGGVAVVVFGVEVVEAGADVDVDEGGDAESPEDVSGVVVPVNALAVDSTVPVTAPTTEPMSDSFII
ncbi:hypothetical protein PHYPSEUDO_005093 [Phytophthora pseudosyringae]|uniref:Uncharacterized protein n=1 Tax=Phytophthora pseudosyringae TaxID=221518 RepID=A0A8T1VM83_9STRA|nr:hypothetical protein PHYPSEUDO_005093 [Phytophthora pseudosyringae]